MCFVQVVAMWYFVGTMLLTLEDSMTGMTLHSSVVACFVSGLRDKVAKSKVLF